MSVQQEHLKMNAEQVESQNEEAPKLEVASPNESLEAFGAALGGALLGMLATLLVLAIFNNGTLVFTGGNSESLQANLTRIDENLGAVNHNVEVLAGQLSAFESSLMDLDASLSSQGVQLEEIDETLVDLEATRENFDIFTSALAQALNEMDTAEAAESDIAAQPAGEQTNSSSPEAIADDVPADAIQAVLFVDENGNGALDAEETALAGASVTLTSGDGEETTASTTDTGVLFEDLTPGEYTVTVEDSVGYSLAGEDSATVTVEEGGEGESVYFRLEPTE